MEHRPNDLFPAEIPGSIFLEAGTISTSHSRDGLALYGASNFGRYDPLIHKTTTPLRRLEPPGAFFRCNRLSLPALRKFLPRMRHKGQHRLRPKVLLLPWILFKGKAQREQQWPSLQRRRRQSSQIRFCLVHVCRALGIRRRRRVFKRDANQTLILSTIRKIRYRCLPLRAALERRNLLRTLQLVPERNMRHQLLSHTGCTSCSWSNTTNRVAVSGSVAHSSRVPALTCAPMKSS